MNRIQQGEILLSRREIKTLRWIRKKCPTIGDFTHMEWAPALNDLEKYAKIKDEAQANRVIRSLSAHGLMTGTIYQEQQTYSTATAKPRMMFKGLLTKDGAQLLRRGSLLLSALAYVIAGAGAVAIFSVLTKVTDPLLGLGLGAFAGAVVKAVAIGETLMRSYFIVD